MAAQTTLTVTNSDRGTTHTLTVGDKVKYSIRVGWSSLEETGVITRITPTRAYIDDTGWYITTTGALHGKKDTYGTYEGPYTRVDALNDKIKHHRGVLKTTVENLYSHNQHGRVIDPKDNAAVEHEEALKAKHLIDEMLEYYQELTALTQN